ncbi:MAG: tetratricopeptide repeat protein [Deltaproteobacteria bacterium]|nr:tetratricopeptide repeat protein [Deltaproteobacteria bacterium]
MLEILHHRAGPSPGTRRRIGKPTRGLALIVMAAVCSSLGAPIWAQTAPPEPASADQGAPPEASSDPAPAITNTSPQQFDSPYEAYEAAIYDQALQGFIDDQVERPEDPELALNIGNSHYKMKNYPEAEKAFGSAALAGDPVVREQALYSLGNCAFRQGKLEDAVELYKGALDLDPDDEDAKFNLEFVRNEIRRRHEENQKRQEEQQQQQQDGEQQQDQQGEQGEQGDQPQDQNQQGEQQQQGGQDSDQDGLPDQVEKDAENPTDPQNPDTDGDGLPDGQEDENRNGRVDEGETDPNQQDTDGDGVPDAQDQQPTDGQQPPQPQEGEEAQAQEAPEGLTPEEAERYLQGLEEGRPEKGKPDQRGRRSRPAKDW